MVDANFFVHNINIDFDVDSDNKIIQANIKSISSSRGLWSILGYSIYNIFQTNLLKSKFESYTVKINQDNHLLDTHQNSLKIFGDIYTPEFFVNDLLISSPGCPWLCHEPYSYTNTKNGNLFYNTLFNFTNELNNLYENLIIKYNIDFDHSLAVCHRGTDKNTEIKIMSSDLWVANTSFIINEYNFSKIILITDQTQTKELFLKTFGERCIVFDELYTTYTSTVVFKFNDFDKDKWLKNISAILRILSKCKGLLNHTGNTATSLAIMRGNTNYMWQVDKNATVLKLF